MRFAASIIQYRTLITELKTIGKSAVNLSYKLIGEGTSEAPKPPIFILHGLLGQKRDWKSMGKTISNMTKRTVVIVDLRNHGYSPHISSNKYVDMAADMIKLLDKLSLKSASLIGHCIGGRMAMCTALLAPERVSGLFVVDVSPVSQCDHLISMIDVLNAMKTIDFSKPTKLSKARKEVKRELRKVIKDEYTMDLVLSNIVYKEAKLSWSCNVDGLIKNFKHLLSFPESLKGKMYEGPSMFVGGQISECLPPDDLLHIRELFPNAMITYITSTSHNLHIQDPKSFLEITIAFLKTNN